MQRMIQSLDHLARKQGTLKPQEYWLFYQELFAPMRGMAAALLELGIHDGGSIKVWEAYLQRAQIAGIDIVVPALSVGERVHLFQGDQADTALLSRVAAEVAPGGFDIIVDDCAHIGAVAKISFWHLFDHHLKPGGLYCIEDWGTGYWSNWPDGRKMMQAPDTERRMPSHDAGMVGLIKQLIDELAVADIRDSFDERAPRPSKFAAMWLRHGVCAIRKAQSSAESPGSDAALPDIAMQAK